jgi:hypothetical protein
MLVHVPRSALRPLRWTFASPRDGAHVDFTLGRR